MGNALVSEVALHLRHDALVQRPMVNGSLSSLTRVRQRKVAQGRFCAVTVAGDVDTSSEGKAEARVRGHINRLQHAVTVGRGGSLVQNLTEKPLWYRGGGC